MVPIGKMQANLGQAWTEVAQFQGNPPTPHFVGVLRALLSEPWWIHWGGFAADSTPEKDLLRRMTQYPYQKPGGAPPATERALGAPRGP